MIAKKNVSPTRKRTWVIILPTQTIHYYFRETPPNCHKFAWFDGTPPPKWVPFNDHLKKDTEVPGLEIFSTTLPDKEPTWLHIHTQQIFETGRGLGLGVEGIGFYDFASSMLGTSDKRFCQMVALFHGDEYHGRIRRKITVKINTR